MNILLEANLLKNLLYRKGFSNTDKILLCLAVSVDKPKTVSEIKSLAKSAGLSKIKDWNVSSYLAKSKGRAIRTDNGWELSDEGKQYVEASLGSLINTPVHKVASSLQAHLAKIQDKDTQAFLDEAIRCCELKMYRAAVVLSWVGAMSLLYDHIIDKKLIEFNFEAKRRDSNWRDAKNKDDLARMKEYDFLQVIASISIIGKNVKEELEGCLKFRNGCGHPNSLKIGENRVSSHIETLILNIFSQYS